MQPTSTPKEHQEALELPGWLLKDWRAGRDLVERVLPYGKQRLRGKGAPILYKEDPSDELFYIRKGAVEVANVVGGMRIVMAIIGEGNFFGEIGFFDRKARTCHVTAVEKSEIVSFNEESMERIRAADPRLYGDFLYLVTQIISRRFRGLLEEQEPITAYAAALTRGRRSFDAATPLPTQFFHSPEWRKVNRHVEGFKAEIYDLSYHLQEGKEGGVPEDAEQKCFAMIDAFSGHLEEIQAWDMPSDRAAYIWGYVFKEVFPYLMRSRFAERAYYKPQGYAGDYYMMEMIYRNRPEGDGKLGLLVDQWMLGSVPCDAVRGRRRLLTEELTSACSALRLRSDRIQIMSLACGPARELCDFLAGFPEADAVDALLVDIDPDALKHAASNLDRSETRASIRYMRENLIRWAMGRVRHHFEAQDVIYSAGLTDYLGRSLFTALVRQCHDHLKPGGILIVGNFGPANPHRAFLDHLLKWELIHRSESELRTIFDDTPFRGDMVEVIAEPHGVNLFVRAVKGD